MEKTIPNQLPVKQLLPEFRDNGDIDLWLNKDELAAVQGLKAPDSNAIQTFAVCIAMMSFILWHSTVMGAVFLTWLVASTFVPVMLSGLAIAKMNEGNVDGALRICATQQTVARWLGPIAVLFDSCFLDQVRAVGLSMNGRLVESQIVLAQRLDASRDILSEPMIQTTLGSIYANNGNFDRALEVYQQRYASSRSFFTEQLSKGIASCNMGWIYLLRGEFEESLRYSTEALDRIRRNSTGLARFLVTSDWNWLQVNCLTNAARACIRLEKFDEAENYLEQALALVGGMSRHPGASSEIYLGYAEMRLLQDRLAEAQLYAQSSIECYRSSVGCAFYSYVYARKVLARILELSGSENESRELMLKAEIDQHSVLEDNETELSRLRSVIRSQQKLLSNTIVY